MKTTQPIYGIQDFASDRELCEDGEFSNRDGNTQQSWATTNRACAEAILRQVRRQHPGEWRIVAIGTVADWPGFLDCRDVGLDPAARVIGVM